MPFFFPPSQSNGVIEAWAQNSVTVSARLLADSYNPIQLNQLSDPNNILVNPATVDPLNDPQFIVSQEGYSTVNAYFNIQISPFQLPLVPPTRLYLGLFVITSNAPAGSWITFASIDIPSETFTPDNRQVYEVPCAIPNVLPIVQDGVVPQFTLGLALPLGSIDTLNVTVFANVQASTTLE